MVKCEHFSSVIDHKQSFVKSKHHLLYMQVLVIKYVWIGTQPKTDTQTPLEFLFCTFSKIIYSSKSSILVLRFLYFKREETLGMPSFFLFLFLKTAPNPVCVFEL